MWVSQSSDFLSHVDKQEKDQKGWCREHVWSLLWWGSIPFQRFFILNYFVTTCFERTTGDSYGLSDQSKIGKGDTPTFPASDLRSSDAGMFD